jgi:1-acyl-sn-glycerol-3-phosphate acyltransferase
VAVKRSLFVRCFYRANWLVVVILGAVWFRARSTRKPRKLPDEGLIWISNHTSMFDPLWVGMGWWRPFRFMASTALWSVPMLGRWMSGVGAFPKKKFVKDKEAVLTLVDMVNQGDIVMLFPEGFRTWDGRTNPVLPGIGRLVHRLGCPVMVTRNLTGHLIRPRWAEHFRFIPLIMEVDEPLRFGPYATPEDIEAEINKRISIDPEPKDIGWLKFGWKLAEGLPRYLWACPACFALDALSVQKKNRNAVSCSGCGRAWEIDLRCRLHGIEGDAPSFTVAEAADAIQSHFGSPPVADAARAAEDGVVLECPHLEVMKLGRKDRDREPVAQGRALLRAGSLELRDPSGKVAWTLALSDLQSVSVEVGSRLHVRIGGDLYGFFPGKESPLKWAYFIRGHWKKDA